MASQKYLVNKKNKAIAQTFWRPLSAFFPSYFLMLPVEECVIIIMCNHYAYAPTHVMEA